MRASVSRGLRVAAAGALVVVGVGVGSGTSGAQTVLVDCDQVAATALVDDGTGLGIGGTVKDLTAKVKGLGTGVALGPWGGGPGEDTPSTLDLASGDADLDIASFKGGASAPCTGPMNQGPLTKLAGKLTGRATCDPASTDPTRYFFNGNLTLTYTNDGNLDGKPDSSKAYVRVDQFFPTFEVVNVHGIVTKGVAPGADFHAPAMFHPYQSKTQPFPQELNDAQSACVPGGGSGTIENWLIMTDGYSLYTLTPGYYCWFDPSLCYWNGSLKLSLP